MSDPQHDDPAVLDLLLDRAGLTPAPTDREALITAMVTADDQRALVHSVTATRYAEPGLVFSARPVKVGRP